MPKTYWALSIGTPKYSIHSISLHLTKREALLSALAYMSIDREDELSDDVDNYGRTDELSDDDLYDVVLETSDITDDEWNIDEVAVPEGAGDVQETR